MYKRYSKRLFDILLSLILLVILFPFMIFVFFLVWATVGFPVFSQQRTKIHGKIFNIYKFKTMNNDRDFDGNLLSDKLRLSKFGKFLRSTSIDELPGLWNVLKGDMSLVGPRPLLVEYLPLYSDRQARRHEVKPGITGWAQINGRNTISWKKKFELDVWYVDNQSFWLDIKILWLTLKKVILRDDINQNNDVTMGKFKGNL